MESIEPNIDAMNKAYRIVESKIYTYNFEIDYDQKSIMYYENGFN